MKKITALLISAIMIFSLFTLPASAATTEPKISASAYIVYNADNGQVLYAKNAEKEVDPSGLSALAVAYLYITKTQDLDKEVAINFNASDADIPGSTSSMLGLRKGNSVKASDILAAVFASAYPDAVRALAEDMSGSEYKTAVPEELNALFESLGFTHTHFSNIYGDYDYEHYISVDEYCKFINEALKNETFKKYFTEKTSEITISGKTKALSNSFKQRDGDQFKYANAIGGLDVKYLSSSARSLISVAEKDGIRLISIIINSASEEEIYDDTESLFEYAFNEFSFVSLSPASIPTKQIETEEGKKFAKIFYDKTLDLYLQNDVGTDNLLYHIDIPDDFGEANPTATLEITQDSDLQYSVVGRYPMTVKFETYNSIVPSQDNTEKKGISAIDIIIIVVIVLLAAAAGVIAWFMFSKKKRELRKARFRKMEKLQDRSLNPSDIKAREEKENLKLGLSSVASEVENFGINEDYIEPPVVVKTERRGTREAIEAAKKAAEEKRAEEMKAEMRDAFDFGEDAPKTHPTYKRTVVTDSRGNEISKEELNENFRKRTEESRRNKETFSVTIKNERGEVLDKETARSLNVHEKKEEAKPRTGTANSIYEAKRKNEEDRLSDSNIKQTTARTVVKSADGKVMDKASVSELNEKDRQSKETVARTTLHKSEKRKARPGELVIKEIKNPDGTVTKKLVPDGDE